MVCLTSILLCCNIKPICTVNLAQTIFYQFLEGYEGDGSESGEDAFTKSCQGLSKRNNAFWMIFKLTKEHVKIFFHCRLVHLIFELDESDRILNHSNKFY